jgi:hypothetical protein
MASQRSCRVLRREIYKSLLPVKILSVSWSSHSFIFSIKSGGSLLTIFSRCANFDSEIFSSLRAFAQVILVGPLLMKALIFRASAMVFGQTGAFGCAPAAKDQLS